MSALALDVSVRRLGAGDAALYRELRQRALAEHPEAFSSSVEDEARVAPDLLARRLAPRPEVPHDAVFGAFEGDRLIGLAGLAVDPRAKVRHRGRVFGMYVARECAGRGVGAMLLAALIEHARRAVELDSLVLTVTAGNDSARRLYERAGFASFGLEPGAVRVDGLAFDKVHMVRWLRAPSGAAAQRVSSSQPPLPDNGAPR